MVRFSCIIIIIIIMMMLLLYLSYHIIIILFFVTKFKKNMTTMVSLGMLIANYKIKTTRIKILNFTPNDTKNTYTFIN